MTKQNIPGKHREFEFPPKVGEKESKELTECAKQDASLNIEVNQDDLTPILHVHKAQLLDYQHRLYLQAQKYFHELQNVAGHADSKAKTHHLEKKLTPTLNFAKEIQNLSHIGDEFNNKKNDYNNFKQVHHRANLPVNSDGSWIQLIVLIGLFVLECVINFSMMYSGGAVTRNEALTVGISQAAINIVSCYIVGKMVVGQIFFAKSPPGKISYLFALCIHAFIIILINANMGLFRSAIIKSQAGDTLSTEQLLQNWSWSPWGQISSLDVTAVLVIGVGVVLALVAYIDGYLSDDPYPGYGRVYRALMRIHKQARAQASSIERKWAAELDTHREAVGVATTERIDAIDQWSTAINDIEQVAEDYKAVLKRLETEYKHRVSLYASTYNKYCNDLRFKINLSEAILLTPDAYKIEVVFKDVKDFFIDDDQRLRQTNKKKDEVSRAIDAIELLIEPVIRQRRKELDDLPKCNPWA